MPKRSLDRDTDEHQAKRLRSNAPDRLSSLSDELILKAFSFLPISELVNCERCANYGPLHSNVADLEDFLIG